MHVPGSYQPSCMFFKEKQQLTNLAIGAIFRTIVFKNRK